jgi:hypothetical protein
VVLWPESVLIGQTLEPRQGNVNWNGRKLVICGRPTKMAPNGEEGAKVKEVKGCFSLLFWTSIHTKGSVFAGHRFSAPLPQTGLSLTVVGRERDIPGAHTAIQWGHFGPGPRGWTATDRRFPTCHNPARTSPPCLRTPWVAGSAEKIDRARTVSPSEVILDILNGFQCNSCRRVKGPGGARFVLDLTSPSRFGTAQIVTLGLLPPPPVGKPPFPGMERVVVVVD